MLSLLIVALLSAVQIPLPEHPRPDFHRAEWLNLNGRWRFAFDYTQAHWIRRLRRAKA